MGVGWVLRHAKYPHNLVIFAKCVPSPVTTVWVKITTSEIHVAPRIFSSTFIYFIHVHPLAFTFVHLHPFSSTFIKNCEISNSGGNIFYKFLYFRVGLCFMKRVFMLIEVIMVLLKILVGFGPIQAVTTCGLSSLASFLKILSSKRVCCVFRDIRDKNAANQGFWSKTAVFSLPATKVDCLLIFWLPHLYNLLQPGIRKQHKYTSIHEHLYLAINKAKFALLLFQPSYCSRVVLCIEMGCI